MNRFLSILLLLCCFGLKSEGQVNYVVKPVSFNSRSWDEFSPVYYKDGIVFCSNQPSNAPVSYGNSRNGIFNIFYVSGNDSLKWKNKQVFAREISADVNQGPATFGKNGEMIYYSRNNNLSGRLKNANDSTNKLGIYSAEFINGKWGNIKPFEHNSTLFTFCTPALSNDGSRLYFASDMPGGYGGLDIYYCERENDAWERPVNLGPLVNTRGNEVFPFACKSGKVYFASDGKPGFGRKDLFYSMEINGSWIEPVHLDSSINSPYDDFGLIADPLGEKGYFSSNRNGTDDIFSFTFITEEFGECQNIVADNYCFTFYDEQQLADTIPLTYEWDFGGGIKRLGPEVKHCFPGPGDYVVKLSIRDEITGEAIVSNVEYDVSLHETEQPVISFYRVGLVNRPVFFDGSKSKLQGQSVKYFWNFDEGYASGGEVCSHTFNKSGEYIIRMGLLQNSGSAGTLKACVESKIRIFNSFEELPPLVNHEDVPAAVLAADKQAMLLRVYMMDGLSREMKDTIKNQLSQSAMYIVFDGYGIVDSSYAILEKVAALLKGNSGLRLVMALHSGEKSVAENFARQLSFFLNQKSVDKVKYTADGFENAQWLFKPYSAEKDRSMGVVELIFVKE